MPSDKTYIFTILIQGTGKTVQEAWDDAVEHCDLSEENYEDFDRERVKNEEL